MAMTASGIAMFGIVMAISGAWGGIIIFILATYFWGKFCEQ